MAQATKALAQVLRAQAQAALSPAILQAWIADHLMTVACILATDNVSALLEHYLVTVTGSSWVVTPAGARLVLPDGRPVFLPVPAEAVQIASFAH